MAFDRVTSDVPPRVKNPEGRLVAEYVAVKFPQYIVATRQPLGPGLDDVSPSASRPWRPEVDAWVIMADPREVRWHYEARARGRGQTTIVVVDEVPPGTVLLLIEGKIRQLIDGLAKLDLYRDLVPETPELVGLAGSETRIRLVAPRIGEWVESLARRRNTELDAFEPEWVRDYWSWRDRYWTAGYRIDRDEKIKARERLGL